MRILTNLMLLQAKGRDDWVGWVELRNAHVNEISVMNTARVIRDVDADILDDPRQKDILLTFWQNLDV